MNYTTEFENKKHAFEKVQKEFEELQKREELRQKEIRDNAIEEAKKEVVLLKEQLVLVNNKKKELEDSIQNYTDFIYTDFCTECDVELPERVLHVCSGDEDGSHKVCGKHKLFQCQHSDYDWYCKNYVCELHAEVIVYKNKTEVNACLSCKTNYEKSGKSY